MREAIGSKELLSRSTTIGPALFTFHGDHCRRNRAIGILHINGALAPNSVTLKLPDLRCRSGCIQDTIRIKP